MNATRINYGSAWRVAEKAAARYLHQQLWWAKFHIVAWIVGWLIRRAAARRPTNRRWRSR